jgi:2-polyprenyl-3-methyl-5-hydroxy-6-metoxy-1,4-benzoquinol methylase
MAVRIDPENTETRTLLDIVELEGKRVLEIGCGDGRLTRRFAEHAASVTAIDPNAEEIARAKEQLPPALLDRVEFQAIQFEDFAAASPNAVFDIILASYSLC